MCTYCALVRLPLNTLIPQGPRFCSSLSPNEQNPQAGFTPGTLLAAPGDLCNYNVSVALPAAPYGQMQSQANGLNFTNVRTLHTIQTHTSTQTIQYTHTHTRHIPYRRTQAHKPYRIHTPDTYGRTTCAQKRDLMRSHAAHRLLTSCRSRCGGNCRSPPLPPGGCASRHSGRVRRNTAQLIHINTHLHASQTRITVISNVYK